MIRTVLKESLSWIECKKIDNIQRISDKVYLVVRHLKVKQRESIAKWNGSKANRSKSSLNQCVDRFGYHGAVLIPQIVPIKARYQLR